jgi:2-hydroxy-6-oxonona-2,4-dienedioate hydrolase
MPWGPLRWQGATGPRGSPTVVVLHGVVAAGSLVAPFADALAARAHVLVPDLPGCGRSPASAYGATVGGLADALALWLRTEGVGVGPAAVCGVSFGCQVALHLADRRPAAVTRLVLQGPTVDAGARSVGVQALRLLADAVHERPSVIGVELRGVARTGLRTAAATVRSAVADRPEAVIGDVPHPILIVRGEDDPLVSQRWAERLASGAPDGRLAVLPGGHGLIHSRPEALLDAVAPFLLGGA